MTSSGKPGSANSRRRSCNIPEPNQKITEFFYTDGYGSKLMRRLISEELKYEETSDPEKADIIWASSTSPCFKSHIFIPSTTLVNYFPGSASISSKSALLRNLRIYCASRANTPSHLDFFPREYDLANPKELHSFLLDFAVTRAEALLRRMTDDQNNNRSYAGIGPAMLMLERLVPVLQRSATANSYYSSPNWWLQASRFSEQEWSLLKGDGQSYKGDEPEGTEKGLLLMEAHWWIQQLENQGQRQPQLGNRKAFWILKEPNANCGRGISVFSELLPLLAEAKSNGWDVMVQKYIERPLLLGPDKRKFDIRLWILATSWNPAVVWAWPEPYLRLASRSFTWDASVVKDHFVHLTNRAVQKTGDGSAKVDGVLEKDEDHIWMLPAFFSYFDSHLRSTGQDSASERWKKFTWPKILDAVRTVFRATQDNVGSHKSTSNFEFFGFDFLLDEDMRPWLLEANKGPDLCFDAGPTLRKLCEDALKETLRLVTGLHQGHLELPKQKDAECDLTIPGAGRWHLCLNEGGEVREKELMFRKASKNMQLPKRAIDKSHSGSNSNGPHSDVLNHLLGNVLPPTGLSSILGPSRDRSSKDDKSNATLPRIGSDVSAGHASPRRHVMDGNSDGKQDRPAYSEASGLAPRPVCVNSQGNQIIPPYRQSKSPKPHQPLNDRSRSQTDALASMRAHKHFQSFKRVSAALALRG
eukprot:gnl/MRDRNA2_/MRDRNA2_123597_c0_seq1.p1 gnl/MRDRNA2_/MRDRNA2_123597_c0~~gnl/MRDRNA2_/MRDRNA2_123597_c0_seq1.p1  ORF type:complete len:698 (+),score=104.79 gnl/MRDRNA2_/MRDRNA2_123597_c0_seq1:163-2256(+)